MSRTCLNISTDIAQRAIHDQKLLDAVALTIGIKMIRIHSAWKTGEGKIKAIVNMFKCCTRTAQRMLNAARELGYIEEGQDYIKAIGTLVHAEDGWSRKTKRHGSFKIKTSFILHLTILDEEHVSYKTIVNEIRDQLVFNAIQHDIRETERKNNLSVAQEETDPLPKKKGTCYLFARKTSNVTTKLLAKVTGQSESSVKNRLNRLEKEGKINIFRNRLKKVGNIMDMAVLPLCAVIIGTIVYERQPNAYSFNSYRDFISSTHVILNHQRRTHIRQEEMGGELVLAQRAGHKDFLLDATNTNLRVRDYYDSINWGGGNMEGFDDRL